jgi:hypothetical protein
MEVSEGELFFVKITTRLLWMPRVYYSVNLKFDSLFALFIDEKKKALTKWTGSRSGI